MLESLGEAQQVMGAQRVVALELDFRLFPGFEQPYLKCLFPEVERTKNLSKGREEGKTQPYDAF